MNRRFFLQSSGFLTASAFLSGCLSSLSQSGSGHPCNNYRNIDYDAVDKYRDHGVYLQNSDENAHTACVTVTKENRDYEETASNPPPLERVGYAVQPEKKVEIFKFRENGHYTIEVSIEKTAKKEVFEISKTEFNDEAARITMFEITGANRIQVKYSGDL